MLIGCIGFLPAVVTAHHYFLFPFKGYFLLFLFIGTCGLIQRRYFYERKIFMGKHFILYSYIGFGASVTMLLLTLNFFIPVSESHIEKFEVTYIKGHRKILSVGPTRNLYMENQLSDNEQVIDYQRRLNKKYLVFSYHYGILGIMKVDYYFFTDNKDAYPDHVSN